VPSRQVRDQVDSRRHEVQRPWFGERHMGEQCARVREGSEASERGEGEKERYEVHGPLNMHAAMHKALLGYVIKSPWLYRGG